MRPGCHQMYIEHRDHRVPIGPMNTEDLFSSDLFCLWAQLLNYFFVWKSVSLVNAVTLPRTCESLELVIRLATLFLQANTSPLGFQFFFPKIRFLRNQTRIFFLKWPNLSFFLSMSSSFSKKTFLYKFQLFTPDLFFVQNLLRFFYFAATRLWIWRL